MATNKKRSPQRPGAPAPSGAGGPRRLGGQAGAPRPTSAGAQRRYERSRRGGSKWMGWAAVGVVVVVVALFVGLKLGSSSPKSTSNTSNGVATGQHPAPASAAVVAAITTIPASVFDSVGVNSLSVPFTVTKNQPPLKVNGLPRFVYMGAEYCPYCAMARYSMVAALSRFGTFTNLKETSSGSSDGNVPTFSFLGSTYKSPYVAFTPYEGLDRQEPNPQPLQTVPKEVSKLYATYDGTPTGTGTKFSPGGAGIPFIDIANQYVSAGDPAPFASLWNTGGPLNNGGPGRLAIAEGIRNPTSSTGKYIQGALFVAQANYMSAAICSLDGNKPASVCHSPGVLAAAKVLAKAPRVG